MQLKENTTLQDGRFRIIRCLGKGGFGITYLAEDRMLRVNVAIKEFFISQHCNRDEYGRVSIGVESMKTTINSYYEKFINEAGKIRKLKHPNIVSVYDVFTENGTAYYTMDYHSNGSLSAMVKKQSRLSEDDALRYIRQIASALKYIHSCNMVHLDVKPDNILLDSNGNAILIDFGISKHYDSEGKATTITPGAYTPGYAAGSQIAGSKINTFSPTLDIYSLGATLYNLITGKEPPLITEILDFGFSSTPKTVSLGTRKAIEKSMAPKSSERPQNIDEFLGLISSNIERIDSPKKNEIINNTNTTKLKRKETKQEMLVNNKIQITVASWNQQYIEGTSSSNEKTVVALPDAHCYAGLTKILYKGCKLNILSSTSDENNILHPHDIIFEPDYLVDISALARCVQPYGSPAIGYILNLLEPTTESAARLLGEAANMFLDDCANERGESRATYKESMQKFFREYPLQLSVCDKIDRTFFDAASEQFFNIQKTIGTQAVESKEEYNRDEVQLEPSFFCETMGLQGRIDLLQNNRLIELKSGKADEFRSSSKEEHKLQMSLYKEMLCYSLQMERSSIKAHLFYSRYPRTYSDECTPTQISNALMLRNHIVALMHKMSKDGLRTMLENLSPDDLNERGDSGRLWSDYLRPAIENILLPIKKADEILLQYVFGNIAFVAREMLIAKVGSSDAAVKQKIAQSGRCFADVWNAPTDTKIENGNILIDLKINHFTDNDGISDIIFDIPTHGSDFFPNFRAGDTVFMYIRNSDKDKAINRQVTRGSLTSITPTQLIIHLRHKQRNRKIFPLEATYAVEHDHLDSTFRASFRDLYSLLTAPKERIELLLARRAPRFDKERTLSGDYGNEYINNIVLKAKQADDLFLLVGPPGTGKTSQALRSMVREFMLDKNCNILLASYTNRAVDEICHTLDHLPEAPEYIRIGCEQSCAEHHRCRLIKNVIACCSNREQIRSTMQQTHIFVGTIASLTARKELFKLKKFHTAIIDEATQILESQLSGLIAAQLPDGTSAIEKFILIGDPKQLPAVVAQPEKDCIVKSEELRNIGITNYGASFFERLYYKHQQNPTDGLVATLYKQGRMHPDVASYANRHFYGNRLVPIPLQHQCEEDIYKQIDSNDHYQQIIATRRTAFIATTTPSGNEIAKINRPEAELIAQFVKAYYKLQKANNLECNPSEEVGIIVPFRNQIAMVTHAIARLDIPNSNNIVIDTVERFQGSQREVILFGTTIWQPEQLEILSSPITDAEGNIIDRKLNVALTRARRRMYIFGNKDILSVSPLYKALIEELN